MNEAQLNMEHVKKNLHAALGLLTDPDNNGVEEAMDLIAGALAILDA